MTCWCKPYSISWSIKAFTRNEFIHIYALKLFENNSQYLQVKQSQERALSQIGILQQIKFVQNKKYHYIYPDCEENILICSIIQADNLEGQPQIILYVYIDDQFAYKSRVYAPSSSPIINLEIDAYAISITQPFL